MAYGSCYLIAGMLGLLVNIVETVKIRRNKRKMGFDNLVASLSIADGISGILFSIIGIGIILLTSGVGDLRLVHYSVMGLNFSVLASLNHVLVIVLQQTFAAFSHGIPAENRLIERLSFVFIWVTAFLYGILSVLVIENFISLNSIIIIVYNAVTMLLYAPIFCKESQRCADMHDDEGHVVNEVIKRPLLHSVLLTVCSFGCFLPFAINNLILKSGISVGITCDVLVAINPIVDALIYFYVNKQQRKRKKMMEHSKPLVAVTHIDTV